MSPSCCKELEQELIALRERYAQLKRDKDAIETRYERDVKKWKQFKKWLIVGDTGVAANGVVQPEDLKLPVLETISSKENLDNNGASPRMLSPTG